MKPDTFYFPHDYDSTSDPKIQTLIGEHGALGYTIFWRLVELLHSTPGNKIPLKNYIFKSLAIQFKETTERIVEVIKYAVDDAELFQRDAADEYIWSERVNKNVEERKAKNIRHANAGKIGGIKSGISRNTRSKPKQGLSNAKHTSTI
jgi:hypothetical protein